MGQITSGNVKYERTLNLGDYNSKKAGAEIAFSAGDDGKDYQAMLDLAGTTAIAKVNELLAIAEKKSAPAPAPAPQNDKAALAAAVEAAAGKTTKGPGRPPKTPPAPPKAEGELPDLGDGDSTLAKKDDTDESLDDLLGDTTPPKPITDEEITSAITQKNGKVKNPVAIRTLIAKFVPPPGQARQIPAEKRAEFLAELDKITAPTAK